MAGYGLLGINGAFMGNLLDLRTQRQEIIGANIANADTPGYKARRLEFEDMLKEALPMEGELTLARTNGKHLPMAYAGPVEGMVQPVETPIPKGDRNSVDLEQEMAMQSANQILYNYATQAIDGQIKKLHLVIGGGQ